MSKKKTGGLRSLVPFGLTASRQKVIDVVAKLLKFCAGRVRHSQYHTASNNGAIREWENLLVNLIDDYCATKVEDEEFTANEIRSIDKILGAALASSHQSLRHSPPLVVQARAIARGIDRALGPKFHSFFRSQHQSPNIYDTSPFEAIEGMAYPACPIPLTKDLFHNLAFRPGGCDDYIDRVPNLRLVPNHLPLQVSFDFRLDNFLTDLVNGHPTRYAVGSVGAVDFDRLDDFYHIIKDLRDKNFGQVSFRDAKDLLPALFKLADENDATVFMLPELCIDQECLGELRELFRESVGSAMRLLVAGSVHMEGDNGTIRNRLHAFVRTSDVSEDADLIEIFHDKIAMFTWRTPEGTILTENIHRDRILNVYLVDGVATAFLVCRDFLLEGVLDTVRALGVRQIFIVALSPETAEFHAHARHLAVTNNAISTIACASPANHPIAIFGGPRRLPAPVVEIQEAEPAVVWIDSVTGDSDVALLQEFR